MELFLLISAILWTGSLAVSEFCSRGFQVATRYHDCWQQAIFSNKYPDLYERHEFLDGGFVERYATHMCSVVKPAALACFKKDVDDCPNKAKLIVLADESGGACKGKLLNPFFKKYVLDFLVPISGDRDSPCFTIGDESYDKCYIAAGKTVMDSGMSDEISRFHKVADLFFETYWDCLVDLYKSQTAKCPNWQLPMLMVLQKTALPSLFGMHLKPEQIFKLELQTGPLSLTKPANKTESEKGNETCATGGEAKKVYLVMEVLTKKPSATSGGGRLVVELTDLHSDSPRLYLEGQEEQDNFREITKFVQVLSQPDTVSNLKERRRRRKEEKKKNKQLNTIIGKLTGTEEEQTKKKSKKKTRKSKSKKSKSKKKKVPPKKTEKDIFDSMIE